MEWLKYHQETAPVLLGEHIYAYKQVVDGLKLMNKDTFDEEKTLNFVLGGFHNPWTAATFIEFGNTIHKGNHQNILLDMNFKPLKEIDKRVPLGLVQARLEDLPFVPESIDMMLMDFTLNFMSDKQIKRFAEESEKALTKNGVILSTYSVYRKRNLIDYLFLENPNPLPDLTFNRTTQQVIKLIKPLKIIFIATFDCMSSFKNKPDAQEFMVVLTRKDNPLPERKGNAFTLTRS